MAENRRVPRPLDEVPTNLREAGNNRPARSFHPAPKSAVTEQPEGAEQATLAARLKAARLEVDRACELLVLASPESMDRSARVLEAAAKRCRPSELRALLPAADRAAALEQTRQLRAAVRRAGHLLETAAKFRRNWTRMLGAMSGGYTGQGAPAPISQASRVSVRG